MSNKQKPSNIVRVESRIHTIRNQRVMLDVDLAELYGVTTKRLNEQIKRNIERFPLDFMFQLSDQEVTALRSQIATSNVGRGGRRYIPYAFTEHGAVMAATILNSPIAIECSIFIVRAFIQMRELIREHSDLQHRLKFVERCMVDRFTDYDEELKEILKRIEELEMPIKAGKKPRSVH